MTIKLTADMCGPAQWYEICAYSPTAGTPTIYYRGWGNEYEAKKFVAIMTRKNPGVVYACKGLGNEVDFDPTTAEDAFDAEDEMWGEGAL